MERALGVLWDVNRDKFIFKVTMKDNPKTRRGILSCTSSIYDPLGFISPVVLPAKKLLQDLARRQLGWDDDIEEDNATKWEGWLKDIPNLADVTIERSIIPENFGDLQLVQLHHFADASEASYGAVTYSRLVNVKDDIHCSFLMGKCRLAPIKTTSVPRLELSAAVLSVKFDKILRDELDIPIHESVFWTDSTAVLGYIRNTSYQSFSYVCSKPSCSHPRWFTTKAMASCSFTRKSC